VSAHANANSAVADVLQDLGYSISSSIDLLKDTLHPFPRLTEQDVARFEYTWHTSDSSVTALVDGSSTRPLTLVLMRCFVCSCVQHRGDDSSYSVCEVASRRYRRF
jgi:hypothetical protein